jgi:hypothetical protein
MLLVAGAFIRHPFFKVDARIDPGVDQVGDQFTTRPSSEKMNSVANTTG